MDHIKKTELYANVTISKPPGDTIFIVMKRKTKVIIYVGGNSWRFTIILGIPFLFHVAN